MTDLPLSQRVLIRATSPAVFKLATVMIMMGGTGLGNKQLAKNTGLSLPTIQAALVTLHEFGMVTQVSRYGGWTLTGPLAELASKVGSSSQKVFDSLIKVDSSLIESKIMDELNTINLSSQNYFDSPADVPDDKMEVLATLHLMGVKDPKASTLALMDHVTIPFLEDFDLGVAYGVLDLPLAIWKIERGQNYGFKFPDKCPGCKGDYDFNTKDLDHSNGCWVEKRINKRWHKR